ncbi:cobalamin-binding protein [Steroidobacter denitrificans]|nr:cobalamin-binding protein [Steroidobacter denitrificans]
MSRVRPLMRMLILAGAVAGPTDSAAALAVASRFGPEVAAVSAAEDDASAVPVRRILSLAPNLTELTFSAGAGERIVGTVEYSNYPEAARAIPRIGDAFRVDLERALALRPDLVLAWDSGTPLPTIEQLRKLQLHVVSIETHVIDDIPAAVRAIGKLAGTSAAADEAAARFEQDMASLRRRYRDRASISVFLQINEQPLYTVNGKHLMSEAVALCGGRNVFAGLGELAPVIGVEAVIAANPQVIINTDYAGAEAVAQWRRWRHIEAVRSGNVYSLPSDDIARATLRLVDGAREICRTLDKARARLGM